MVFQMFGVEWVMPRRVVDLLACWNRRVGHNDINIVSTIPSFLMWCTWRERNARSFDNRERMSSDLQTCFLNPYLSGSLLLPFSMSLATLIFVLFFLTLDCCVFLLYTSYVLGLRALVLLMNFLS